MSRKKIIRKGDKREKLHQEGRRNQMSCDKWDLNFIENEMGFKVHDVTEHLPEASVPILVSEKLEEALRAAPGDYEAWVWDLFFMGAKSPSRVRQDYNVYFRFVLGGLMTTACVTQCGGRFTEAFFVFALAGENIYFGHDVENPEVRKLMQPDDSLCDRRAAVAATKEKRNECRES